MTEKKGILSRKTIINFSVFMYSASIFVVNFLYFAAFIGIIFDMGLKEAYRESVLILVLPIFYLLIGTFSAYSTMGTDSKPAREKFLRWTGMDIKKDSQLFFLNSFFLLMFIVLTFGVLQQIGT